MRTSNIPSVRVSPELRAAAEAELRAGETLSSFVESSVRKSVQERAAQRAFIERGLAASSHARTSGEYVTEEQLLAELDAILDGRLDALDDR